MKFELLWYILMFVLLWMVQALVCNQICLFDCASPMIYVYLPLTFRINYPRWGVLAWCFVMGLCVDISSNTPGVGAASMTLVGLLQPYLLDLFMPRDSQENFLPTMKTLGASKYVWYAISLVFIHCFTFFTLEAFNLYHWAQWIGCVFGSTALTTLLILAVERFRTS